MRHCPQAWAQCNQAITQLAPGAAAASFDTAPTAPDTCWAGWHGATDQLTAAGSAGCNALRMPPRAYVMPRVPTAG